MYSFLSANPHRAKRFAAGMSSIGGNTGMQFLSNTFSFATLPEGSVVVDVGGSKGHVSSYLAQQHAHLKFIVQDLAEVVGDRKETSKTPAGVPEEVEDRVEHMAHDFFEEQPIKGADVYIFRYIFHNWSDAYCVKILRALIPALKKGSKVVVNDHLLPEPGTLEQSKERDIRYAFPHSPPPRELPALIWKQGNGYDDAFFDERT